MNEPAQGNALPVSAIAVFGAFYITLLMVLVMLAMQMQTAIPAVGGSVVLLLASLGAVGVQAFKRGRGLDQDEQKGLMIGAIGLDVVVQYTLLSAGGGGVGDGATLLRLFVAYLIYNVLPLVVGILLLGPKLEARVNRERG